MIPPAQFVKVMPSFVESRFDSLNLRSQVRGKIRRNCQDLWMGLSRSSLITSCLVGLFGEIWLTAMRSRTCW
jgi:cytochrome c biogenesis protein CcdA